MELYFITRFICSHYVIRIFTRNFTKRYPFNCFCICMKYSFDHMLRTNISMRKFKQSAHSKRALCTWSPAYLIVENHCFDNVGCAHCSLLTALCPLLTHYKPYTVRLMNIHSNGTAWWYRMFSSECGGERYWQWQTYLIDQWILGKYIVFVPFDCMRKVLTHNNTINQ